MTLFGGELAWKVAAGSVAGAEHARLSRDGQDGFAVRVGPRRVIAVVTDGCGSAPFSEVGARLGAAWLAAACDRLDERALVDDSSARRVHHELVRGIRALARASAGRASPAFVSDYLLFTYLVAIVDDASYLVFGVGDGAVSINGRATILDSGPANDPEYAAYALVPGMRAPEVVVHAKGPAGELESVFLATDGAGDLLATGDLPATRIARNPSLLRKTLVRARAEGRLFDDATCVAVVRAPGGAVVKRIVEGGRTKQLDPAARIGQGGEGEVYRLAPGRAVKVFFDPMSAKKRRKIERFPRDLPTEVVGPDAVAFDTDGTAVGYTMRLVEGAQDLGVLGTARLSAGAISRGWISSFFARVARVLSEIHAAGVVVGDLNPGNVLFVPSTEELAFIDAESMQYAGFPCEVAHERYVDPALYGKDFGARPCFSAGTDHYALAVLLFSSLLHTHPYGGVHPAYPTMLKRALARHSVLRADVKLPKVATPPRVLSDGLLGYFHGVFEEGRRDPIPEARLHDAWTICSCGVEHARRACPVCSASVPVPVAVAAVSAGEITSLLLFDTKGTILDAEMRGGKLAWIYRTKDGLFREDGAPVPDARFPFGPPAVTCENGVLRRRDEGTILGRVLEGQTWVRTGDTLGLGVYRPGRMSVFFVFDVRSGRLRDVEGMPLLRGKVIRCDAVFDDGHALFVATTEELGREYVTAALVDRSGTVLAIEEAACADEASPWVGAGRPALSGGHVVLATKDGLVLLRPDPRARRFEVKRTWAAGDLAGADLFSGPRGSLFCVTPNEVRRLTVI